MTGIDYTVSQRHFSREMQYRHYGAQISRIHLFKTCVFQVRMDEERRNGDVIFCSH